MPRYINADKPRLWKPDIAALVDQFNQWFIRFAPETFRNTRTTTTEKVKRALLATNDLHNITPAVLKRVLKSFPPFVCVRPRRSPLTA